MSATELAIERMCELAGVSRRGFYRFDPDAKPEERDMDLRNAIQRIALEMPSYGRPRVTAELRRRGWKVNAKRVHRIMREDNLLCLRRRKFLVTTDSRHGLPVYPNLAGEVQLTDINQLWIADITYIRLEIEFVAFSRRVIGWALDRTLGGEAHRSSARNGSIGPQGESGAGTSFRPWHSVRGERLYQPSRTARYSNQYEPQRKSLGQRADGKLYENSQIRGGLPAGVPRFARRTSFAPPFYREGL
jgi:hypothetical protein